jgi:hypothetical protein
MIHFGYFWLYFPSLLIILLLAAVESKLLQARIKMQQKYIDQFHMLYDDFNITKLPLLPEEVSNLLLPLSPNICRLLVQFCTKMPLLPEEVSNLLLPLSPNICRLLVQFCTKKRQILGRGVYH